MLSCKSKSFQVLQEWDLDTVEMGLLYCVLYIGWFQKNIVGTMENILEAHAGYWIISLLLLTWGVTA